MKKVVGFMETFFWRYFIPSIVVVAVVLVLVVGVIAGVLVQVEEAAVA